MEQQNEDITHQKEVRIKSNAQELSKNLISEPCLPFIVSDTNEFQFKTVRLHGKVIMMFGQRSENDKKMEKKCAMPRIKPATTQTKRKYYLQSNMDKGIKENSKNNSQIVEFIHPIKQEKLESKQNQRKQERKIKIKTTQHVKIEDTNIINCNLNRCKKKVVLAQINVSEKENELKANRSQKSQQKSYKANKSVRSLKNVASANQLFNKKQKKLNDKKIKKQVATVTNLQPIVKVKQPQVDKIQNWEGLYDPIFKIWAGWCPVQQSNENQAKGKEQNQNPKNHEQNEQNRKASVFQNQEKIQKIQKENENHKEMTINSPQKKIQSNTIQPTPKKQKQLENSRASTKKSLPSNVRNSNKVTYSIFNKNKNIKKAQKNKNSESKNVLKKNRAPIIQKLEELNQNDEMLTKYQKIIASDSQWIQNTQFQSALLSHPNLKIIYIQPQPQTALFPRNLQIPNHFITPSSFLSNPNLINFLNFILLVNPSIISDLFEPPSHKVYSVWLYFINSNNSKERIHDYNSKFQPVYVDGKFIFDEHFFPIFGWVQQYIWINVLIKCFAKILGDYKQIQTLTIQDTYTLLTGKCIVFYDEDKMNLIRQSFQCFIECLQASRDAGNITGIIHQSQFYQIVTILREDFEESGTDRSRKTDKHLQHKLSLEAYQSLNNYIEGEKKIKAEKQNMRHTVVKVRKAHKGKDKFVQFIKLADILKEGWQFFEIHS